MQPSCGAHAWSALPWRRTPRSSSLPPSPAVRAAVSDLLFPLEGAAAVGVLFLVAVRLRAEPRLLVGWLLVGLSWLCTAVRDGGWWISEVFFREPPFPSPIDFINLLGYPLFLLGVSFLSPLQRLFREQARLLVDIAIVLIGTAMFLWTFAFIPLQRNGVGNPPAHYALALIYPASDFLAIAAAVILLYCPRKAAFAGSAWLLIAAAIVRVVTDFTFGYMNLAGTYRSGSLFEIGWAVSTALCVLAALRWLDPGMRARAGAPDGEDETSPAAGSPVAQLPAVRMDRRRPCHRGVDARPSSSNGQATSPCHDRRHHPACRRPPASHSRPESADEPGAAGSAGDPRTARQGEDRGVERANRELSLLDQVRTAMAAEIEIPAIVRRIVESVAATFEYSHVSLYLLEGDTLVLQHQVGYAQSVARIPVERGISGRVARTGRPVLVPDVREDRDYLEAFEGVCSDVIVPILDGRTVLGTLSVESTRGRRLGEPDLHLIAAVGAQAGMAISRAMVLGYAQESEEALRRERETLETRVKERTAELERANEELVVEAAERLRQEEQLRLLSRAVERATESLMIFDCTGVLLYANPAFQRITGHTPESATPGQFMVFFRDNPRLPAEMQAAVRGLKPWGGVLTLTRPDKNRLTVDLSIAPLLDDAGRCAHWVGVMSDITERSLMEERIRQGEKLEALGKFAGGIAHDFNNLLAIIIGYVRLALESHDTVGEARRGMDLVAATAERAAALTRRLLAFSRQQARDVHLLDLNLVINGMSDMVSRLVGEHVSCYISGAHGIWPVRADRLQVEQIVLNLASNSADAMPAGGALVIETSNLSIGTLIACFPDSIPPGRYVRLQVRDTGNGVPAEVRAAHLRAVLHHQGARKGTGLGLATVYAAVRQSEGHICLETAQGAGTTFSIYLPAQEGTPEVATAPEEPARNAARKRDGSRRG